jgi:pyruvate/2-oxoglutarate dehydrogenase complex dihydrolipoamide dehydrogenase (E3) component
MIILGAGAAGLFASGAASSLLGKKTALFELVSVIPSSSSSSSFLDSGGNLNVGGDCSNAACVPSKAIRSMARQAAAWKRTTSHFVLFGMIMDNYGEVIGALRGWGHALLPSNWSIVFKWVKLRVIYIFGNWSEEKKRGLANICPSLI